ncbi:tellurite resistance TerB family protein [Rhizobium sp. SG2393]|uniref:tellurite resistance TerB family protein n=1 Tax=Rhizobium sp. SG2393 TaxID=3276279 RepID=UPI00366F2BE4
MFDAKKLLEQFLGSQMPMGGGTIRDRAGQATEMARNNPLKATAIAGLLLGTGTGRKLAGSALKIGGLAAIAGLGYAAYRNYQAGKAPQAPAEAAREIPKLLPPPSDSGFSIEPQAVSQEFALMLIRAMIAAARADGHIDANERAHIHERLSASELSSDAAAFIERELTDPTDLDAIIASARTEEQKVELYTAVRLTIEPDTRAERGFLDLVAGRLGLPDALLDHIDSTVAGAKVAV